MEIIFWGCLLLLTGLALLPILFAPPGLARITQFSMLLALPIVALTLYSFIGNAPALIHYWHLQREASRMSDRLSQMKNPETIIRLLQAQLSKHPNSPQGWYLLGKLYLSQQAYTPATQALATAHHQQPSNPNYATAYATASFFKHNRRLTPEIEALLHTLLNHNPNQIDALNLLAMDYYLKKQYSYAITDWERLLPLLEPNSPEQQWILSLIAKAQKEQYSVLHKVYSSIK